MSSARAWPPTVSIVIAAHDEEACLPELLSRLRAVLEREVAAFELVVIDDGSDDRTFELVEAAARADARVRGIRLSRNEGHQIALLRGLERAAGDVVITIDADLQHPPERIVDMLAAWRDGADVVHMQRRDPLSLQPRDLAARGFYLLFNWLSATPVPPGSTDFRLLDARCVAPLLSTPGSARFLRAAVRQIGFRQVELPFTAAPRRAGRSSYTLRRLLDLGALAIFETTRALVVLPIVAGLALVVASLVAFVGPGVGDRAGAWTIALSLGVAALAIATTLAGFGTRAAPQRAAHPLGFVEREVGVARLAPAPRRLRLVDASTQGDDEPRAVHGA